MVKVSVCAHIRTQVLTAPLIYAGATRKQLGLTFQGETRAQHTLASEMEVFNLDRNVSSSTIRAVQQC